MSTETQNMTFEELKEYVEYYTSNPFYQVKVSVVR